ncbi:MAG: hypothetical protein D6798_05700 [Deltaproteobacteria bacterium]|nr:MAG: hypothetical protein D6798_05700 [Deltaproteobacteria bacterium]
MSRVTPIAVLVALALAACSSEEPEIDSDGDGLTDSQEQELGTDPQAVDSDGDLLDDADEIDLGTDPTDADTDDDGYLDGWEVNEGKDPTDYLSRIYKGFWPYNPDKDSLPGGAWSTFDADEGQILPRSALLDQFGDTVDMFDFNDQGPYLAIDVSAMWCGPCKALAEWMTGGDDLYGFEDYWSHVRMAVEDGRLQWITIMSEDRSGAVPDQDDLVDWYLDYEDPKTPILSDEDGHFQDLIRAYPSMFFFDPNFTLISAPGNTDSTHYQPMDAMEEFFSE